VLFNDKKYVYVTLSALMNDDDYNEPVVDESAYIHPSAVIIGNVKLGKNVSIWPGAVLRGDISAIEIGEASNVQDNAVFHTTASYPAILGKYVTVGHNAVVHGAIIEDYVIVGMNATVLEGSVVGTGSIIGANALVKAGDRIPPYSLVVGVPGKVKKTDPFMKKRAKENAMEYLLLMEKYKSGSIKEYNI